ncbi:MULTISPECIES: putative bacteriophage Lambda NinG protein [Haemophilus]|uniref:Putative bacteriophage Lambda NinG protein n=1 Tax=Haemophilus paraphrohaemolyticus HK411 TaxID=1095743 RepID=I2NPA6_9PAST|nr:MULTISPECIES: putative bacteriophage Lambda NinG protein [Haemophilus]EIG27667.1 putative bacteriophage Lambda NinG protein [Haemophilus paraphrohaemolyticus HK411]OOR94244.1 hypothetical protein B0184_08230 [Haemophilus paraphrohaemolyticus]STP01922.1 Bacteriophage Lambda NinG protein [Haemophilus paraphrohaemolyticus]
MNLEVLYQENLELRAKLKLLTDKPLERKKIVHTKADLIFSDYIRKRANYCCERCGKHYPPKTNGLQCSHNFSRRYYNIRYHPDNAIALCHYCHMWYGNEPIESGKWIVEKIGEEKANELIRLKNLPNSQSHPTEEEYEKIIATYLQLCILESL